MCLYIGSKKSIVSNRDIEVYKYVKRNGLGQYLTPYQNATVEFNKLMVASTNGEAIVENYVNKYQINGGAIHSCVSSKDKNFSEFICFKAIIPAGTEFWVQNDMKQIASRQLYITDEVVEDDRHTDMDEVYRIIYSASPCNKVGIKVGDLLLKDKTYVSPFDEFKKSDVIGIVGYIHPKSDEAICMSVDCAELPFMERYDVYNSCHSKITSEDILNDYDGYEHSHAIAGSDDYDSDNFKALSYCLGYKTEGTEKGEWYMPSIGECVALVRNMLYINVSLNYNGISKLMDYNWMWSSSQLLYGRYAYSWHCRLSNGHCSYDWIHRDDKGEVRPLLAFIKQA